MPSSYKVDGGFGDDWHSKMWDYLRPQVGNAYWGGYNTALTDSHYPADVLAPPSSNTISLPVSSISGFGFVAVDVDGGGHITTVAPSSVTLANTTVVVAPVVGTGSLVAEPPIEEFATISGGAVAVDSPVVTGGVTAEEPPEVAIESPAVTTTTDATSDPLVAEAPPEVSITSDAIRRPGDTSEGTFEDFPPVDITISGPFAISSPPVVTSGFMYVEDIAGNVTLEPDLVDINGAGWAGGAAVAYDAATGSSQGVATVVASAEVTEAGSPNEELESAPSLYRRLWQIVHRMKLRDKDQ